MATWGVTRAPLEHDDLGLDSLSECVCVCVSVSVCATKNDESCVECGQSIVVEISSECTSKVVNLHFVFPSYFF